MLILNLIDVQYLQNVNFSFEKGSNGQISLFLEVSPPNKKSPQQNCSFPPTVGRDFPPPLNAIWKILRKLHLDGFPPLFTFGNFDFHINNENNFFGMLCTSLHTLSPYLPY